MTRQIIVAIALLACALLVWAAADVLLVLFAAILFAIFLRRFAGFVHRHTGWSGGYCITAVLAILLLSIILVGWIAAPSISEQTSQLIDQLPQTLEHARGWLQHQSWGHDLLGKLQHSPASGSGGWLGRLTGYASTTLSAVANAAIVFFVGLYLAIDPKTYRRGVLLLLPDSSRARAAQVFDAIGEALGHWLAGKLTGMAFVAVITIGGLLLLGVPLALLLGLLAAMLDFIPNIGPILALAPALLLASGSGGTTVLWVAALYLGVQLVESYFLVPMIQRKAVSLPPALTIAWQVLIGALLGITGLIVATPLLVVVMTSVKLLYVDQTAGSSRS